MKELKNNSSLGDVEDMDVSYDCELNSFSNLEPTSFEEFFVHDEWKQVM